MEDIYCHIQLKKQTSDRHKVVIKNVEVNKYCDHITLNLHKESQGHSSCQRRI